MLWRGFEPACTVNPSLASYQISAG